MSGRGKLAMRLRPLLEEAFGSDAVGRMLRGVGSFLFVHVAGIGIAYLANAYIARRLGAHGYGLFVYGTTWKNVLLVPATFGLWVGSLRFSAAYAGNAQWGMLRGFLAWSRHLTLALSLATAAVFSAIVWLLGERLPAELAPILWIAAATLPLHAFMLLHGSLLRGFGRLLASQIPQALAYPALQFAAIAALGVTAAWQAAALDGLVIALVALALAALCVRNTPPETRVPPPLHDSRVWIAALVPLVWIDLVNVVIERSDILMLGALVDTREAGVYAVASRVATVVTFGLVAGNAWAAPQFSERFARNEMAELQRLVRSVSRLILLFTVPAVLGILVLGPFLLGVFGDEFRAAFPVLVILAGSHLVSAAMGPVAYLTTMTGGQRDAAIALTGAALIGVAANALLIPRFGAMGSAWAALLARVFWNVAMASRLYQRTGLRAFAL